MLDTLLSTIHVEKAEVMVPEMSEEPEIFLEFCKILDETELSPLGRFEFYKQWHQAPPTPAISIGEKKTFANILITVSVA